MFDLLTDRLSTSTHRLFVGGRTLSEEQSKEEHEKKQGSKNCCGWLTNNSNTTSNTVGQSCGQQENTEKDNDFCLKITAEYFLAEQNFRLISSWRLN